MSVGARVAGLSEAVRFVHFDGRHFVFESPKAFAPGQPMQVDVDGEPALRLDLKSLGSVKQSDGQFRVRARATTITRAARDALIRLFPSAP
ncbi:MAG: hypothetical protein RL385_2201 [Pseudomonadota bacterium]|jgi:hypothetical protein